MRGPGREAEKVVRERRSQDPGGEGAGPHGAGIRRPWPGIAWALWALAVLLFLVLQVSPLVNRVSEDEALLVYDAHRVSQGQVPYRDFFGLWAPGGFYAFAGGPSGWWGRPETGCRYLQVVVILLFTLLLARALRGWGPWRWPLAALLPVVLFPLHPFMGNHWFALLGTLAAAMAAIGLWRRPEPFWRWAVLGGAAALAGWFLQPQGALAATVAAATLLLVPSGPGQRLRMALWTLAGAAAASAILLAPLLWAGAERALFADAVTWPLLNYRRSGNVVDAPLFTGLGERLSDLWAAPHALSSWYGLPVALAGSFSSAVVLSCFLGLCGLSLFHLVMVAAGRRPARSEATLASLVGIASGLLFVRVSPGWASLGYVIAPAALLWGLGSPGAGGARWRKGVPILACAALACSVVYGNRAYFAGAHSRWEYSDVDREDRESPLNRSLRALPFMEAGDTIAILPSGGNTYLYTYPAGIGYTQLFVLELRHHTVEDHRRVAEEIERNRPKLVLFHAVSAASFMAPGDPIGEAVTKGYAFWTRTPAVVAYLRKDVSAGVPGGGHGLEHGGSG